MRLKEWQARSGAYTPLVYFIQCGKDGPIKVGRTLDVEGRLKGLQTASPYELRLRGVITCDQPMKLEAALHEAFAATRLRGEWFEPSPDLLDLIRLEARRPPIRPAPPPRICEPVETDPLTAEEEAELELYREVVEAVHHNPNRVRFSKTPEGRRYYENLRNGAAA